MKVIKMLSDWQQIREGIPYEQSIGFVPTMGALHRGHASLIRRSKRENALTVVSIFVNPTQFNETSDYDHYPSTFDNDYQLNKEIGVDYLLVPDCHALYPEGQMASLTSQHEMATILEGKHRPNHFDGVLTVMMKWLNLVQPQTLYLGEKDYQQYILVADMVKNYFIPTQVTPCETVREPSGLAYSSRNQRLSQEEKKLAEQFAKLVKQCTPKTLSKTRSAMEALGIQLDYLTFIANRLFAAAWIGEVRLIDNLFTTGESSC